jgi:hypothetical protein
VLPAYRHHSDRLIFECAAAMDAIMSGAVAVRANSSAPLAANARIGDF